MASLCFPNHLQFQNCQKNFWPRRRRVFLRDIRDLPREIHSKDRWPGLWGVFLLGSYLTNTSPSHQLAGPGLPWTISQYDLGCFTLKKTPTSKNVQQKDLLTKVLHTPNVSQLRKPKNASRGIPAFSSWIHFQCWPGRQHQAARGEGAKLRDDGASKTLGFLRVPTKAWGIIDLWLIPDMYKYV